MPSDSIRDLLSWLELEFQGDGQRERITFCCPNGPDAPCEVFSCTDPLLPVLVKKELELLHDRDGHIVPPEQAGLQEWLLLLELKHGPVDVIAGELPRWETEDEQDEGEGTLYVH